MWNSEHGKLAGIHCQLLDEYLLRGEPTLKEYWQLRDACRTTDAVAALKNDVGGILSATYIKPLPGVRSRLSMRLSDLEVMGRGGESINIAQNTKSTIDKMEDEEIGITHLRVLGLDSGTWPMDGGGVASCRRDVVMNVKNIAWNMIAEVGNDMKVVQKSTNILKVQKSLFHV